MEIIIKIWPFVVVLTIIPAGIASVVTIFGPKQLKYIAMVATFLPGFMMGADFSGAEKSFNIFKMIGYGLISMFLLFGGGLWTRYRASATTYFHVFLRNYWSNSK